MRKVPVIVLSVAAAAGLLYAEGAHVFAGRFPFNTTLNGTDVSLKRVSDADALLPAPETPVYTLTLKGMDGQSDTITGDDIGLTSTYEEPESAASASTVNLSWLSESLSGTEITVPLTTTYDDTRLVTAVESLCFFTGPTDLGDAADNPSEVTETSADAATEGATDSSTDTDTSDSQGQLAVLDEERVLSAVRTAIADGDTTLDLVESGCYITAGGETGSDNTDQQVEDADITLAADTLDNFSNFTLTLTFGSNVETIDSATINSWLSLDGGSIVINDDAVNTYVRSLASKYNTTGNTRTLTTSTGSVVSIAPGTYGWILDQASTKQAIVNAINSQTPGAVTPVFSQEAYQFGAQDWGPNYVEIDLDNQHVYVYKDGALAVSTDCVSGNASLGRNTPDGAFYILFKQRDATLTGQGYASPVSYWMPFYLGCGLHDATWRSAFGGTIYLYNGSHGCINLPYSAAQQIFEAVYSGEPVFVYGGATQDSVGSYYAASAASSETEESTEEASSEEASSESSEEETADTGSSKEADETAESAASESSESSASAETSEAPDTGSSSSSESASTAQSVPTEAEKQAIIEQAVKNYETLGLSHEDAVAQVQADLDEQLAQQQEAAAMGQ